LKKEYFTPRGVHPTNFQSKDPRYSHAVKVGNTIYVSGQAGINERGEIADGFEAQCIQLFENMKRVLEAAGASLEDVVKLTGYFLNYSRDRSKYHEIKARYFSQPMPACTNMQITQLGLPEVLTEVEAVAVVGDEH